MSPRKSGFYVAFKRGKVEPEVVEVVLEDVARVYRVGRTESYTLGEFIFERRIKI